MLSCLNLGRIVLNAYRHPIQSLTTWYNNFALSIWGGEVKNFVLKSVSYTLLVCLLVLIGCSQEQKIQGLIQDLGRKTPMIGKEALPDLIQTLRDKKSEFRASAAEVLGRIGSEDPETIMALWKVENTTQEFLKSNRKAFGRANPTEAAKALADTVPALIRALQDVDPTVRANAANALIRIGTPEAIESVLTVLKQALQNEDSAVRANVAKLLEKIGTPEALKILKANTPDQP